MRREGLNILCFPARKPLEGFFTAAVHFNVCEAVQKPFSPRDRSERALRSSGFSGTVSNTSLHDVIQLICIGRGTCRMRVTSGTKKGLIQFKEGEIVHAESEDTDGEEAFYRILSWEIGVFDCEQSPPEKETIEESWDFLLMESLRRVDVLRGA